MTLTFSNPEIPSSCLDLAELPIGLREVFQAPKKIYIQGKVENLFHPLLLGVVGSRRPSAYGLRAAHAFSLALVQAGAVLVSGLARGIDSVAHRCSVESGKPTVAVLGHGLGQIYPAENAALAAAILSTGGTLLTEYPPGIPPLPQNFPQRNRIISGLCRGTVVVEAGQKSGSKITARHALEQGRDIFVVPGCYFDENFGGSHSLIQQGAKLVVHPQDVLEEYGIEFTQSMVSGPLAAMGRTRSAVSLQEAIAAYGGSAGEARAALEKAIFEGWVKELHPNQFLFVHP
jgi:DNA processing protein